jgi:hypothetical protein
LLLQLNGDDAAAQSYGMVPIDPGRSGVNYFDLGSLDPGRYAVAIGYLPLPDAGASPAASVIYVAGFIAGP